ncbi:DsbA family protein [Patescibacteria group bacterium]
MPSPDLLPQDLGEVKKQNKTRTVIAAIVTVIILLGISLFSWRVLYFMRLIQEGQIDTQDFSFLQEQTISEKIMAMPLASQSENKLLTSDDPALGSNLAKVTIVEFADFECPFCRKSSLTMRLIAQKYGDRINYIYRDFPMSEIHPQAQLAAEASECAQEQGKFWEYHDKLYINQSDLRVEKLIQYAREIGLNDQSFATCLKSGRYTNEVLEDYQAGLEAGVRGTPTFIINGNLIPGAVPAEILEALIEKFSE